MLSRIGYQLCTSKLRIYHSLIRKQQIFIHSQASELFKPTVNDFGNKLEIKVNNWPQSLNFSYIWLRDHCRCNECYETKTSQRLLDLSTIPTSICPSAINFNSDGITINWPDGHNSNYDYKFLWQNSFDGKLPLKSPYKKTWNKKSFPDMTEITTDVEAFKTSEGQKSVINSILINGVGIVTGATPTVENTEQLVESLCKVKETLYGKIWGFSNDGAYADLAYSNTHLAAHTDGTYFSEAPRIQVFHVLRQAEKGGENLLVDGFKVAELFKKINPQGYDFLSKYHIESEYIGDGSHLKASGPVFRHNIITQELKQFRHNLYDRAPLSAIAFKHIDEYYRYIIDLAKLVQNPQNEVWMKLQPGEILFIDNWRVMHGRAAFEGKRKMSGCYIEENDFASKARTQGFHI